MMASGPASNVPANRHWFVPLSPEERRKKNKEDDALANRQVYDDVFTFFQSLPEKCDASVPPNLNAEFQPPDGYDWTPLPSPDSSPHRPVYQVRYQTAKEQVVTLRDAPTYQSVQIDRPRPLKTSDETHRYPYYSPVPLLTDAQIVSQLHTLFAHSDQVKAVTKQADASSAQGIFVAQSLDSAWLNGWLWWTDDTGRLLLFHAKGV